MVYYLYQANNKTENRFVHFSGLSTEREKRFHFYLQCQKPYVSQSSHCASFSHLAAMQQHILSYSLTQLVTSNAASTLRKK